MQMPKKLSRRSFRIRSTNKMSSTIVLNRMAKTTKNKPKVTMGAYSLVNMLITKRKVPTMKNISAIIRADFNEIVSPCFVVMLLWIWWVVVQNCHVKIEVLL